MSQRMFDRNVRLRTRLTLLTRRLYDSATPESVRRDLSMDVAIIRSRLAGVRDPLDAMINGSGESDES